MTVTDPARDHVRTDDDDPAPPVGVAPDLDAHPERYDLTGLDGVAWALRDLARAKAAIAGATAQRDAHVAAIDTWLEGETRTARRRVEVLEALLERYARIARDRGLATVKTPYGRLQTRARPDAMPVDTGIFIAHELGDAGQAAVRDLDDRYPLLRVKLEVNAAELRKVARRADVIERTTGVDDAGEPVWTRTGEVLYRGAAGDEMLALDGEGDVRRLDDLDRVVEVVLHDGEGRPLAGVSIVPQDPNVTIIDEVKPEALVIPLAPVGIAPAGATVEVPR